MPVFYIVSYCELFRCDIIRKYNTLMIKIQINE